jgi:hypothetical protein
MIFLILISVVLAVALVCYFFGEIYDEMGN